MDKNTLPAYKLIRSARKTLAIQITPEGQVVVRCPNRLPVRAVEAFLLEKAEWIRGHLEAKQNAPKAEPFTDAQLRAFAVRTRQLLDERLPVLSRAAGVSYQKVTVRAQRTRWGSCSSKGNLNFNCLLALVPPEVFDYVVVHELCHCREMNHSSRFWAEVEALLPHYKASKKWLKEEGSALILRLDSAPRQGK